MLAGRLAEARAGLNAVTGDQFAAAKTSLLRAIEQREKPAPATNAPPGTRANGP